MHFLFAALYMHICVLLCARLCVFKLKKIILSIPCVSYAQLNICLLSRLFIVAALEKTPSSSMLSLNFFFYFEKYCHPKVVPYSDIWI